MISCIKRNVHDDLRELQPKGHSGSTRARFHPQESWMKCASCGKGMIIMPSRSRAPAMGSGTDEDDGISAFGDLPLTAGRREEIRALGGFDLDEVDLPAPKGMLPDIIDLPAPGGAGPQRGAIRSSASWTGSAGARRAHQPAAGRLAAASGQDLLAPVGPTSRRRMLPTRRICSRPSGPRRGAIRRRNSHRRISRICSRRWVPRPTRSEPA